MNGHSVLAYVDTAADVTVISSATASFFNVPVLACNKKVYTADGSPMAISGRAFVDLTACGITIYNTSVIVAPLYVECLLGLDVLTKFPATIDLQSLTLIPAVKKLSKRSAN